MSGDSDSAVVEREDAAESEEKVLGKKRKPSRCYTCGDEGHLARDCTRTKCHYCGREGHIAKTCTMGSSEELSSLFILCQSQPEALQEQQDATSESHAPPLKCFVRRFIIQLSSAPPNFDVDNLTAGRVDVGCRCAANALFRSQSLRHNTEIRLSFAGSKDMNKKGRRKDAGTTEEAVTVAVSGGLVRSLQPDELHIASRLSSALREYISSKNTNGAPASTAAEIEPHLPLEGGAHLAQVQETQLEREGEPQGQQQSKLSKQQLQQQEALRQKLSRGLRCWDGGLSQSILSALTCASQHDQRAEAGAEADAESKRMEAGGDGVGTVEEEGGTKVDEEGGRMMKVGEVGEGRGVQDGGRKMEEGGGRRILLELHPDGERIEECLGRLRQQSSVGGGGPSLEQVVVVLGDNQGLTAADSEAVQRAASEGGAEHFRVALGSSMLLASQCIVLVHYFLDTLLHNCPERLWEAPGKEVVKRRKQTQKRRRKVAP